MRLSGFAVALLLFISAILILTINSSAAGPGASSSSGSSHSSGGSISSGGSVSHTSSSTISHPSTSSVERAPATSPKQVSPKENGEPNEKGRSLFHPFRKPNPVEKVEPRCWNGSCTVCPPGSHSRNGGCTPVSTSCFSGRTWNGFACGVRYERYWSNNCQSLLAQLQAQRARMRARPGDLGETLRYRSLLEQYQQCMHRSQFVSYAPFTDLFLFDNIP